MFAQQNTLDLRDVAMGKRIKIKENDLEGDVKLVIDVKVDPEVKVEPGPKP